MIKAILFDIGGVILNMEDMLIPVKEIFKPKDIDKFWQELNIKFSKLSCGEGDLLEFWKEIAKEKRIKIEEPKLKKIMIDDFSRYVKVNKEIKNIIFSLKKNYRLGLISNTIREHMAQLIKDNSFVEIYSKFDVIVLSYEVKMAKDKKDIFLLALDRLKLKPEECIFIDDTKKFVENANSLGIHGIQFKDAAKLKIELKKLGINI